MKTEFLNLRSLKPARILEYEITIKFDRKLYYPTESLKIDKNLN